MFRRAAVLLPLIRASLQARGYNKTVAALQEKMRNAGGGKLPAAELTGKTVRMVRAAVRYSFVRFTCLEESLGLWYLLQTQGIPAQLRIGVRKSDGKFEAHAWVERDGEALNQPDATHKHYAAFEKEFSGDFAEPR
ncbi:MAG TPA: lasso peptide biosynthesis B2 protein [Candidatus Eisenbacteria bacterium]|nr:lasso peptide biosynthesis B2 protein [Candidatus Eisenbacteria bacterium]